MTYSVPSQASLLAWITYGESFAGILRQVRVRRQISQQILAELSGVSRSQICNLERTDRFVDPTLSTVYKLAQALEVPPAVLLPGVGEMVTPLCAGMAQEGGREEAAVLHPEHVAPFPASYVEQRRRDQRLAAQWRQRREWKRPVQRQV
ncbi:helix-turn-helix domain-containing protein [Corynebacterium lizhenjunii]|uniref:helix-turn-helix domain-containing protein n=1 Tax=Corynebacterium lizhenjunii TaxID=2709394 RepID=UPI0013EB5AB1|nr:helix-turn-helix transcriptional regulator [Corynebacterium lizhenjunii]